VPGGHGRETAELPQGTRADGADAQACYEREIIGRPRPTLRRQNNQAREAILPRRSSKAVEASAKSRPL